MINMFKKFFSIEEDLDGLLLIKTGFNITTKAEEMGKKKIFKPTEYEINEFIHKCINYREALLRGIDKSKQKIDITIIPSELINNIENHEILNLNDCKRLGEYFIEIGDLLKQYLV